MPESLKQQIDQLEGLYESELDPQGRAFVPLADAHRRLGDLDKALAVIQKGLSAHPNFASAHLVLGWVHRSREEPDDAMRAFGRVLVLDEENTFARAGIAELVDERTAQDEVAVEGSGEPSAEDKRPIVSIASLAPGAPLETVAASDAVPDDARPVVPIASLAPGAPLATGAPAETVATPDAAVPGDDRAVVPIASLAPGAPAETVTAPDAAVRGDERAVVPIASLAPGAPVETGVVPIASLAPEAPAETDVVPIASLAPVEQDGTVSESGPDSDLRPVVPILSLAPEGGEETSDDDETIDGEIYTETLAELYTAQGATGRAIEVYEKLIADDPDNEALRRRLTELESLESAADGGPAPLDVRAGLGELLAGPDGRQTVSIESLAPDGNG